MANKHKFEHHFLDDIGLKQLITRINKRFATIKSLEEETSRAKSVEELLQTDINNEVRRASDEETRLNNLIDEEVNRAKISEEDIIKNLNDETDRAIKAEQILKNDITLEETRAITEEDRLNNLIDEEVNRAIKAEDLLKRDIFLEETRASTEEKQLDARLTFIENLPKVKDITINDVTIVDEETRIASIRTGEPNTIASLDENGLVPKTQLPDDLCRNNIVVVETLPEEGEEDVLNVLKSDHVIKQWVGKSTEVPDGWKEIGGVDKDLRKEFEDHVEAEFPHASIQQRLTQKADISLLAAHINNKENPHEVTKLQIGLGKVDNTSDEEKPISVATQLVLNDKLDKTEAYVALEEKINYDDIEDNLITSNPKRVLSANQGVILDGEIAKINSKITSFGSALLFKGVVPSVRDLDNIENPSIGDCYQINSKLNNELTDEDWDGAMFAWDGNSWINIVASATDLTSITATLAEVKKIIDDYDKE